MSRDKKRDDDEESPADWIVRQSRFTRLLKPAGPLRNRSDRESYSAHKYGKSPQVKNAWRDSKPYHDPDDPIASCFDADDGSCLKLTTRLAKSRKWRRLLLVLVLFLGTSIYLFTYHIWPVLTDDYEMKTGFLRQARGTVGLAMGGDYEFAKEKIAQLDSLLIPGGEADQEGKRRLVFVGDIHGCKDELLSLLRAVDFDETYDHLIATGDVISKGRNSPGVVDELIRLKASSVRGNHEDRILTLAAVKVDKFGQPEQLSKTAKRASNVLKQLKPHHLDFLRGLPLILRIPPFPKALASKKQDPEAIHSEILVAHAGLVPAVPLAKQDPYFVMNIRSLTQGSHVPSIQTASKAAHLLHWFDSWDWYHARLSEGRVFNGWHRPEPGLEEGDTTWLDWFLGLFQKREHRQKGKPKAQVIVYGHDSMAGVVIKRWSKGLDSGCAQGGQLTALVLDAYGHETIKSVQCRKA